MSTLIERIATDLTQAMKARDELRTSLLRMAKSALTNKEIEKKAALSEDEALKVLQGLVKQRQDAVELYVKGGRQELADKEQAEIALLRSYLPAAASAEELDVAVERALRETGATSVKDMGKVVKAAQALLKAAGKPADGKAISEAVRSKLG